MLHITTAGRLPRYSLSLEGFRFLELSIRSIWRPSFAVDQIDHCYDFCANRIHVLWAALDSTQLRPPLGRSLHIPGPAGSRPIRVVFCFSLDHVIIRSGTAQDSMFCVFVGGSASPREPYGSPKPILQYDSYSATPVPL